MCASTVCRSDSAARYTLVVAAADALGAHPDLAGGLLARDVQRPAPGLRPSGGRPRAAASTCRRPGSPASSVTEPGTTPPPSTRSSSSTPVGQCRVVSGSIELIGTAGESARTGPRDAVAGDRAEHSHLVDGAPGAALRAPTHPFGGDVVALRAAVLRTRRSPRRDGIGRVRQSRRITTRVVHASAAARGAVPSPAVIGTGHAGLAGRLELEREVVGQAVGDRLGQLTTAAGRSAASAASSASASGPRASPTISIRGGRSRGRRSPSPCRCRTVIADEPVGDQSGDWLTATNTRFDASARARGSHRSAAR